MTVNHTNPNVNNFDNTIKNIYSFRNNFKSLKHCYYSTININMDSWSLVFVFVFNICICVCIWSLYQRVVEYNGNRDEGTWRIRGFAVCIIDQPGRHYDLITIINEEAFSWNFHFHWIYSFFMILVNTSQAQL